MCKIQSYNSKMKTCRLKIIALDKENLTEPNEFITFDLHKERESYTFGLGAEFPTPKLKERKSTQ